MNADNDAQQYAVFHATERGEEMYLRVNRPLELLDAAASVCIHNDMKKILPQLSYREFYSPVDEITKTEFETAVAKRMENTGIVTGAFQMDFDLGEFSALHIMDGWKTFRMEDVCKAMKKVSEVKGLDRDEMFRTLTEQLDGKEMRYAPQPAPSFSVLHVTSRGESRYTRTDVPVPFPEIAEELRRYLGRNREKKPATFDLCYPGIQLSPGEFDGHVSDYLNRRSDAAGVYDVNLDAGIFCVLRAGQGWERYSVSDVCHVAWMASHEQTFKARQEHFNAEIAQRKSMLIPPAVFHHAVTVQGNDLHLAVFHLKEHQTDAWFSISAPAQSFFAATALREYLLRQQDQPGVSISGFFREARSMSRNDYEWYTANCLGRSDIVTQVYDLDLDNGAFSVLHTDGWKHYPVDVVCDAAHLASNLTQLSPIPEQQRLLDRIAGQEIRREDLEIYIRGDRHLDPGEISLSDSVEQMDKLLNFYMDVCFPPDVVLGTFVETDENDDYVNVYANYDLERGTLCDELDVMLWRGDGDCVEMKYRLSPEEKELLLPKMEEHCQRNTGMTLSAWREQYLAEQSAEVPSPEPEERILLPSELAEAIRSDAPALFRQPVRIQIEPDEWISCNSFREYANAMQYPDHTRVHIPEATEKLLTLLVDSGQITAWQANKLHGEYTFDDDGREALYWPEPEEAVARLGFPELAEALRQGQGEPQWEQQM